MTIDVGNLTGKKRTRALRAAQKRILKEALKHLNTKLLGCLEKIPEDWDGFELRWLLCKAADYYSYNPDKQRRKEFENECLVRNLPW